jgi:glucose-6-phosphate isomerase
MDQEIRVDVSRARAAAVGKDHGIVPGELKEIESRIAAAHEILRRERENGTYGFWDLYKDKAVLDDVKTTAQDFLSKGYDNLVILGIGGSALGTTALAAALKPPFYNLLTRRVREGRPRLFVMDNIDPVTFHALMRLCPPHKTLYNVISKSGGTAETMAQLMVVVNTIEKRLGKDAMAEHVVVTTNPRSGGAPPSLLHPVADAYGLKCFTVPLNVGGRFSVFSPVGMFPAALLGIDVDELAAGCAAMDKRCAASGVSVNPAYFHAAFQYLAYTRKGKVMSVMMPYADGLAALADWYRQLWAESLGKRESLHGDEVFVGQTPIKALGATDQHSQIQLYREGPNDKIINIIEVTRSGKTVRIPEALPFVEPLAYLRSKSLNKLLRAELRGTMDALRTSQRPVVRIVIPRLNAHTVAQLMYMLEIETAMSGKLHNVQAFNQPGVEEGKRIARRLMGGQA